MGRYDPNLAVSSVRLNVPSRNVDPVPLAKGSWKVNSDLSRGVDEMTEDSGRPGVSISSDAIDPSSSVPTHAQSPPRAIPNSVSFSFIASNSLKVRTGSEFDLVIATVPTDTATISNCISLYAGGLSSSSSSSLGSRDTSTDVGSLSELEGMLVRGVEVSGDEATGRVAEECRDRGGKVVGGGGGAEIPILGSRPIPLDIGVPILNGEIYEDACCP